MSPFDTTPCTPLLSPVPETPLSAIPDEVHTQAKAPRTSMKIPRTGLKATPLSGFTKTPLRGPLVERAEKLREVCVSALGMEKFIKAIEVSSLSRISSVDVVAMRYVVPLWTQVLTHHDESEADALLIQEMGQSTFNEMKASLYQTVMCEQALHGLNEISRDLIPEMRPVYMG